jgi:hypothetical protein
MDYNYQENLLNFSKDIVKFKEEAIKTKDIASFYNILENSIEKINNLLKVKFTKVSYLLYLNNILEYLDTYRNNIFIGGSISGYYNGHMKENNILFIDRIDLLIDNSKNDIVYNIANMLYNIKIKDKKVFNDIIVRINGTNFIEIISNNYVIIRITLYQSEKDSRIRENLILKYIEKTDPLFGGCLKKDYYVNIINTNLLEYLHLNDFLDNNMSKFDKIHNFNTLGNLEQNNLCMETKNNEVQKLVNKYINELYSKLHGYYIDNTHIVINLRKNIKYYNARNIYDKDSIDLDITNFLVQKLNNASYNINVSNETSLLFSSSNITITYNNNLLGIVTVTDKCIPYYKKNGRRYISPYYILYEYLYHNIFNDKISNSLMCAYNKIFEEFKNLNKKYGITHLDQHYKEGSVLMYNPFYIFNIICNTETEKIYNIQKNDIYILSNNVLKDYIEKKWGLGIENETEIIYSDPIYIKHKNSYYKNYQLFNVQAFYRLIYNARNNLLFNTDNFMDSFNYDTLFNNYMKDMRGVQYLLESLESGKSPINIKTQNGEVYVNSNIVTHLESILTYINNLDDTTFNNTRKDLEKLMTATNIIQERSNHIKTRGCITHTPYTTSSTYKIAGDYCNIEFVTRNHKNAKVHEVINELTTIQKKFIKYINKLTKYNVSGEGEDLEYIKSQSNRKIEYIKYGAYPKILYIRNQGYDFEEDQDILDIRNEYEKVGSYHINITLPFFDAQNILEFEFMHIFFGRVVQFIQPLIVGLYGCPDFRFVKNNDLRYTKCSYRLFESTGPFISTTYLDDFKNYTLNDRSFEFNMDDDNKDHVYFMNNLHKLIDPYRKSNGGIYNGIDSRMINQRIGSDFSRRYYDRYITEFGFELRILDTFDPKYLKPILSFIIRLSDLVYLLHKRNNTKDNLLGNVRVYWKTNKDLVDIWIEQFSSIIKNGWKSENLKFNNIIIKLMNDVSMSDKYENILKQYIKVNIFVLMEVFNLFLFETFGNSGYFSVNLIGVEESINNNKLTNLNYLYTIDACEYHSDIMNKYHLDFLIKNMPIDNSYFKAALIERFKKVGISVPFGLNIEKLQKNILLLNLNNFPSIEKKVRLLISAIYLSINLPRKLFTSHILEETQYKEIIPTEIDSSKIYENICKYSAEYVLKNTFVEYINTDKKDINYYIGLLHFYKNLTNENFKGMHIVVHNSVGQNSFEFIYYHSNKMGNRVINIRISNTGNIEKITRSSLSLENKETIFKNKYNNILKMILDLITNNSDNHIKYFRELQELLLIFDIRDIDKTILLQIEEVTKKNKSDNLINYIFHCRENVDIYSPELNKYYAI